MLRVRSAALAKEACLLPYRHAWFADRGHRARRPEGNNNSQRARRATSVTVFGPYQDRTLPATRRARTTQDLKSEQVSVPFRVEKSPTLMRVDVEKGWTAITVRGSGNLSDITHDLRYERSEIRRLGIRHQSDLRSRKTDRTDPLITRLHRVRHHKIDGVRTQRSTSSMKTPSESFASRATFDRPVMGR